MGLLTSTENVILQIHKLELYRIDTQISGYYTGGAIWNLFPNKAPSRAHCEQLFQIQLHRQTFVMAVEMTVW